MKGIAIVGAGFCGTLVAVHLLKSRKPLNLYLIDKNGSFAAGIAYSTVEPHHYLNVPAGAMSAFPDLPAHFCQWLRAHGFADYDAASFVPRFVFHRYLHNLLQTALHSASTLNLIKAEALEAIKEGEKLEILLSNGETISSDALVIATGIPAAKSLSQSLGAEGIEGYTQNVWQPAPNSLLAMTDLSHLSADTHVAVIGSGLTMADALMTLFTRGFKGHAIILSKHGWISEAHRNAFPPFPPFINLDHLPETTIGLFRLVRAKLQEARKLGIDWRPVIDSLRTFTPGIWAKLPAAEKKKFLRHVYSIWNRHRHRLPPQTAHRIAKAQAIGKIGLLKGRFVFLERKQNGFQITYQAEGQNHTFQAEHVINCTGLDYSSIKKDAFLRQLCENDLAALDELNLGLRWASQGPVYILGALLFGERFETIAVPELRQQAAQIAHSILDTN